MSNEIVLENEKQGNPESEWGLTNGASSSIEGFTTDISTNIGGTVQFKVDTDATQYRLDIYRLGYYNGDGARLVASIQHSGAENQPAPIVDTSTATVDAGNWSVTDSWAVPTGSVSGVYIAKLVREDGTTGENHIPFIVRDDTGHSDVVFQTSDTTWQAYNDWGGANLYGNDLNTGADRAYAVSYNRPLDTTAVINTIFGDGEYSAIRFLEKNGYDVSYISGVDTARSGSELLDHKLFLSVGHDEYWSADQRANVEAARDAGVNLAFWSGNEVYWEGRWQPSLDSTPDDYRTFVSYKESWSQAKIDPDPQWTGTWRDTLESDWTGSGERSHWHHVHGQFASFRHDQCFIRLFEVSILGEHGRRKSAAWTIGKSRAWNAWLRVGHRPGQRLPSGRLGRPVFDHRPSEQPYYWAERPGRKYSR